MTLRLVLLVLLAVLLAQVIDAAEVAIATDHAAMLR